MLYYTTYHLIYTALLFFICLFSQKKSHVYISTYELHLLASFSDLTSPWSHLQLSSLS